MGESSASRLRGDSITDVIFNGSSSRKPIGAASVELLFDNSNTTLEGQYAKYSEISIRREVSRDGISAYFLNGTKCRRKDITGVFLGTGLGPRSYSIIEQGMISRLIEAKPEEMRVFIEEAAGISKYKERRRETSNRIKHTKENLDRLLDVLDEVEKQIKHLDRQARTAERYGKYKKEERRTSAELLALRTKNLDDRGAGSRSRLEECKTNLEAAIAKQRSLEASIEDARVRQSESTDGFNEVQGRYYKVGGEIARLEQSIEHARELRKRQEQDLEQAIHEDALAEWQRQWDAHTLQLNEATQQHNIESSRAEQIESRLQSFTERRKKIDVAQAVASPEELQGNYDDLVEQELRKRQARDEFDRHLTDIAEKIRKLREQDQKLSRLVEERRASLQEAQGKLASLEALQAAALGEGDDGIKTWLEGAGLEGNRRVAQTLKVDGGWEKAVETVLGDYLQAVCVADITPVTESIARLRSGAVTVLRETSKDDTDRVTENTLASKVAGAPAAARDRLAGVRFADSLGEALAIRERLADDESVVTADGIWLGKNWLRVTREKDGKAGVLAREHEMRRLKSEMREMQARFDSARRLLADGRIRLTQLEERRETLQQDASSLLNEYSEVKAALESAKYRVDQANARKVAVAEEVAELDNEKISAEEQLRESRRKHGEAAESIDRLQAERAELETQREELRAELQRVRAQSDEDRQTVQNITIQFESRRNSKESAAQNLQRMQRQLQQCRTYSACSVSCSSSVLANTKYVNNCRAIRHRMRTIRSGLRNCLKTGLR
jgi:chromosome segregation protein